MKRLCGAKKYGYKTFDDVVLLMRRNDEIKTDPEIPKLLGQVQYYSRISITVSI